MIVSQNSPSLASNPGIFSPGHTARVNQIMKMLISEQVASGVMIATRRLLDGMVRKAQSRILNNL